MGCRNKRNGKGLEVEDVFSLDGPALGSYGRSGPPDEFEEFLGRPDWVVRPFPRSGRCVLGDATIRCQVLALQAYFCLQRF